MQSWSLKEKVKPTNLNDIETDVLIEGVENKFGDSAVVPRPVHQQQLGEETEL